MVVLGLLYTLHHSVPAQANQTVLTDLSPGSTVSDIQCYHLSRGTQLQPLPLLQQRDFPG